MQTWSDQITVQIKQTVILKRTAENFLNKG